MPSLDRIGATGSGREGVSILFAPCPGETVERVVLNLTDDDFEVVEDVVWEIEADSAASTLTSFEVGRTPEGFRTVTPLGVELEPDHRVQAVVTTSNGDTIPMSFIVGDVDRTAVLSRGDTFKSPREWAAAADAACGSG